MAEISAEEARRELARRELERRKQIKGDGGAMGAAISGFTDAGMLGFADEAVGAIGGVVEGLGRPEGFSGAYQRVRDNTRRMMERQQENNAGSYLAGQVGGGVATSFIPGGAAAKGASLASKGARAAATGAGLGAVYGAGSAETMQQIPNEAAKGALWGAGLGAGAAGIGHAAGKIAQGRAVKKLMGNKAIPDTEDLGAMAGREYDALDNAHAVIARPAYERMRQEIGQELANERFDPEFHKALADSLASVDRVTQYNPTFSDVRTMLRRLEPALKSSDPDERRLAMIAKRKIDDFVTSVGPRDIITGDPAAIMATKKKADALYTRKKKSEQIDWAREQAERRANRTGSGGNSENTLRQEISKLLQAERQPGKRKRGWTADEMAAMQRVENGGNSALLRGARVVGKLSPQGNGLMAALGIGGTAANPLLAAVPAVGMVAKKISEGNTARNADILQALVRSGGKLPASNQQQIDRIIRALIGGQQAPAAMTISGQ